MPTENSEIHRDFTQKRLQLIFDTGEGPEESECPCVDCVQLYANRPQKTLLERALDSSTRMTYDMLPTNAKYLIRLNDGYVDQRNEFL